MPLYRVSAEIYLLVSVVVTPIIGVLGWVLLGEALRKHLRSYVRWYTPLVIGGSFTACAVLLETFVTFFARRNYVLLSTVYLLSLAGLPFHIVSFARLWKVIRDLPPSAGDQPQKDNRQQSEGVWPPPPRPRP